MGNPALKAIGEEMYASGEKAGEQAMIFKNDLHFVGIPGSLEETMILFRSKHGKGHGPLYWTGLTQAALDWLVKRMPPERKCCPGNTDWDRAKDEGWNEYRAEVLKMLEAHE